MAEFIERHCRFPHLSAERKKELATILLGRLEEFCPAMADEIRGMAEGARIALTDVCANNFQSLFGFVRTDACSNVLFSTSDHGPLLGKNADLEVNAPKYTALIIKRYKSGLSIAGYAYKGKVSMQGISSKGLATGGSSVTVKEPAAEPEGLPDSIVAGALLHRCGSVDEAVRLLHGVQFFGKGANLALLDAAGDGAVFEICRTHRHVIRFGAQRWLACTNFFISGAVEQANVPRYIQNARARFEVISNLIGQARSLTLELMLAILRHRDEQGTSVCQRDFELNMHSRPSYVAMPAERAILMTDDYPDSSEFVEYAL
jgi:predicted choloylglycine hydrolase